MGRAEAAAEAAASPRNAAEAAALASIAPTASASAVDVDDKPDAVAAARASSHCDTIAHAGEPSDRTATPSMVGGRGSGNEADSVVVDQSVLATDAATDAATAIASFAFVGGGAAPKASVPPPPPPPPIPSLKLFPQNDPADRENALRLAQIQSSLMTYLASESGGKMDGCLAPTTLDLKLDAQVILLKNIDAGSKLVNGARGVVTGFQPAAARPDVRSAPPAPAAAAASWSSGARREDATDDAVDDTPTGLYPLVRFSNGIERLITPEEWSVEQGGKVTAQRIQIPLKLAWAISIHKSQGMTLDSVELELAHCFEPGQAYVALSRSVSLEATRLLSFEPSRVRAHPAVLAFYRELDSGGGDLGTSSSGHSNAVGNTGASASGTAATSATVSVSSLTEEQAARMAANKAAALARVAARKAALASEI